MNFDTKHLVRWGIPGWILIMSLGPYIFFNYHGELDKTFSKNAVAIGAFLTVVGVPLGYLLNQIHHSLTWVFIRMKPVNLLFKRYNNNEEWETYFKQEIKIDKLFLEKDIGQIKKERYSYLLSRKHELGSVTTSLAVALFTIGIIKLVEHNNEKWSWIYLIIILVLFLILWMSRNYSSKNIDVYYKHYLQESEQLPSNNPPTNVSVNNEGQS